MRAQIVKRYKDAPEGAIGEIIKERVDKKNKKWYTLYFGLNEEGDRVEQKFPEDCIEMIDTDLRYDLDWLKFICMIYTEYEIRWKKYCSLKNRFLRLIGK